MSATNRGAERRADDFYATPGWATHALLTWMQDRNEFPQGTVLDPFAGDGAILRVLVERHKLRHFLAAVEIRSEERPALDAAADRVQIGDWFAVHGEFCVETIITNPPYSRAEEAIRSCCAAADRVAMLLRLPFFAGQRRRALFAEHPPAHVLVLAKRPSFTSGGTDATDYAWFVWDRGHIGPASLERLEVTP